MRPENLDLSMHDGYLFELRPSFCDGAITYVLAMEGTVTAYGPCPVVAAAALGRDNCRLSYEECVRRVCAEACDVYMVDDGKATTFMAAGSLKADSAPPPRLFCRETAALASAAAGWPDPVQLFPTEEAT